MGDDFFSWSAFLGAIAGTALSLGVKFLFDRFTEGGARQTQWQEDDLTEALTLIEQIVKVSEEVHSHSNHNGSQEKLERYLLRAMAALGAALERLFEDDLKLKRMIDVKLNKFENAVTDEGFGQNQRPALPEKMKVISDISAQLKRELKSKSRKLPRPYGTLK